MVKVLIVQWIIMHCDRQSYKGMRWYNRELGIFSLYWKHQSSRSCRENTKESADYYEYYRAWARHKNNMKRKQPRDLKAAFRNALEKKDELERLPEMDNKVLIFWRIKNFPYDDPSSPQEKISKPQKNTSNRGRKPKRLSQIKTESSVNYGASSSDSTEDFTPDKKRPPKLSVKILTQMERRKNRKSSLKEKINPPQSYLPTTNGLSISYEGDSDSSPLPPFNTLVNEHKGYESLRSSSSAKFSYNGKSDENLWTPQFLSNSNKYSSALSTDMEIPLELMDYPFPSQPTTYSLQPSPTTQNANVIFNCNTELVNLGRSEYMEETYTSPFTQGEIIHNQPYSKTLDTTSSPTQSGCSIPELITKFSNLLESNVPEVSKISSSSFPYEYEQYSNTNFHQTFSTYPFYSSSPSLDNIANNIYPCVESPSSSEVSSVDYGHLQMYKDDGSVCTTGDELIDQFNDEDSGISDMEDLTDYANKLLDDISEKYNALQK